MSRSTGFVLAYGDCGEERFIAAPNGKVWESESEAKDYMRAMLSNNSMDTLASIYGKGFALHMRVEVAECWASSREPIRLIQ